MSSPQPSPQLTMYTTSWCGYCVRLKRMMQREDISFAEVNIEYDEDAVQLVMSVNGGNQTVPTVVFADGSALTNPSIDQVKTKLARSSSPPAYHGGPPVL